jgi:hypothetical protein
VWSVFLVQGTEVLEENHRPVASHCQLYLIQMYRVHLTTTLVVIDIDCIGRCKSNFQAMTITTTSGELVCSSSIDGFVLPIWYIQALLLKKVGGILVGLNCGPLIYN